MPGSTTTRVAHGDPSAKPPPPRSEARSRHRPWLRLGCLLALAVAPWDSGAQLGQASTGYAFARAFESPADVELTQGSDALGVTLDATAVDRLDLQDDFWLLDFEYAASVSGDATVSWGQATGNLALDTSSRPELSPPVVGATSEPLYNLDSAQAGGTLFLTFTELGTITSDTLPTGTPVAVDLSGRVSSSVIVQGSLDPPNETRAGAAFEGRIIDNSGGFVGAEVLTSGNEVETRTLASAVGHVLEIRGVFRVTAEAFAGASLCCPGYTEEATATIAAAGGLWLSLPAGVSLAASSGHDYTVPVPEPAVPALGLAAALAIAALRAAGVEPGIRRRDRAEGGGPVGRSGRSALGSPVDPCRRRRIRGSTRRRCRSATRRSRRSRTAAG